MSQATPLVNINITINGSEIRTEKTNAPSFDSSERILTAQFEPIPAIPVNRTALKDAEEVKTLLTDPADYAAFYFETPYDLGDSARVICRTRNVDDDGEAGELFQRDRTSAVRGGDAVLLTYRYAVAILLQPQVINGVTTRWSGERVRVHIRINETTTHPRLGACLFTEVITVT